jgi:hypothetical protein
MAGEWEYAIYVARGAALEYVHFSHGQAAGTLDEFAGRFGESVRLRDSTDGYIRFVKGPQPTADVLGALGSLCWELVAVVDGPSTSSGRSREPGTRRPRETARMAIVLHR